MSWSLSTFPTDDPDWTDKLFAGACFFFRPDSAQLHSKLIELVESYFPCHPTQAHKHLDAAQMTRTVARLRDDFARDFCQQHKAHISALLTETGLDTADLYWDKLVLRIAPPLTSSSHGCFDQQHTPPHRDTWGVNIYSQINWWSPVYPVDQRSTIRLYPDYWTRPLANTTASWSFGKYLAAKQNSPEHCDYPIMPESLEQPENGTPILVPQDNWLIFSAAQMHDSVPNYGDTIRFSIEFRTISSSHIDQGRQAPNLDNQSGENMMRIFSHLDSGQPLSEQAAQ